MDKKDLSLAPAEWSIMEYLWESAPHTGREVTDAMSERCGWNRSTTLTLLRRLEAKGAIGSNEGSGMKSFFPLVSRNNVAQGEAKSLLSRAYQGSLSLLVSSFVEKGDLSKREIDELRAVLEQLKEKEND